MALSSKNVGASEFSHGRNRHGNPDSDYQTGVNSLPFPIATNRGAGGGLPVEVSGGVGDAGGSKRGGTTAELIRQAELRLDPTNSTETVDEMFTAKGNPDFYPDAQPLVSEVARVRPGNYKQPVVKTGVFRNDAYQ